MNIVSTLDFKKLAKRKLPRFLFEYIEGGSYNEFTLAKNISDLNNIALKQRILKKIDHINLETTLFGSQVSLPICLGPVGLTGMYARRGEVQAALAASNKGIPYTQSTVSVCSLEEVASKNPLMHWCQLYVLKDRGFMKNILTRARSLGIETLVFTADMPVPGARYRDAHSGMSGYLAAQRRILQAITKPEWALDVGLLGRPHDLGNISEYFQKKTDLVSYTQWLNKNFDPSISWTDLEWIRDFWKGNLIIKGILDVEDAKDAVKFGADGIIVSNHGGRQLDGVLSTASALPAIADAVGDDLTILVDSGIRSGLDVVKMLALGAKAVLLGRSAIYALAAKGQAGVEHLLDIFADEMRVAMTLTGVTSIDKLNRSNLINQN